jgi:UDP-GlcNAc:undecaprenyl-phosphate/decaprenyl-phosphate GlcNAc-1-phosphate transferase
LSPYLPYLALFALAAVATWLACFPVSWAAVRLGIVDHPGEHRMHAHPTPIAGGAAMLVGFLVALAAASQVSSLSSLFRGSSEAAGVALGGLIIYLVGLLDDVRDISAPAKVAGQVLAAMALVGLGVTMYYFKFPFYPTIFNLSPTELPLVTALWVVVMANAVNLIDGLDGLAAGIVVIAAGSLCVYGLRLEHLGDLSPDNLGPLVAALACGACVGFLPHNFHPARLFMGDGGALLLGLLMAAATMVIGGRTETGSANGIDVSGLTFFRFAPLFLPFFILGVPILDTAFAIVRRTARRSSFAERDLGHLHHRLVRLGHGHRRSVLILWSWTAVLSAFVLLPVFDSQANAFVTIGVAVLCIALYTLFHPGLPSRAERQAARRAAAEGAGEGLPAPAVAVPQGAPVGPQVPITVSMSGAAGVAVAGEPDLTGAPRRRRPVRHGAKLRAHRERKTSSRQVRAPRLRSRVARRDPEVRG